MFSSWTCCLWGKKDVPVKDAQLEELDIKWIESANRNEKPYLQLTLAAQEVKSKSKNKATLNRIDALLTKLDGINGTLTFNSSEGKHTTDHIARFIYERSDDKNTLIIRKVENNNGTPLDFDKIKHSRYLLTNLDKFWQTTEKSKLLNIAGGHILRPM